MYNAATMTTHVPLFDPEDVERIVFSQRFILGPYEFIGYDITATLAWDGDFTGVMEGQIGPDDMQFTWATSLPIALAKSCFTLLLTAELTSEPYQPYRAFFGPTLYRRLELTTSAELVRFYTNSHGKYQVPWEVTVTGQSYTCRTEALGEAWGLLYQVLEIEERTEMLTDAWEESQRTKAPKRKTKRRF